MLSRSPLPDPLYHIYINSSPTPTYTGPSMDPGTADFRAFYPYTPNEVKHRKRTTSTQLKTLENVFRRDTKPNGPLRVELATKLGMTPRGVQVWFQNRRAKEKNKACKAAKDTADSAEPDNLNQDSPTSPEDVEHTPDPPDAGHCPLDVEESSSQSSSPSSASPPTLHVITNSAPPIWQGPGPRSDSLPHDQPERLDKDLHAARRGSLPVNAFVNVEHANNSPQSLHFDPFGRRLSVDASLQRLANNPYAHLARAKNGALFGSRGMAHPRRLTGRAPFAPYIQRPPHNAPMNYRLDMRRASADPRSFHPQPRGSSPSSLSHYHGIRTSLPEHNLYAVTSRSLPSPIPGPLPSPNFSFGAASTPSMSTSSGSDRNSPDSLQSFTFRGEEFDEEDLTSASVSRFGSIASVATSDSSINSSYYPDVNTCVGDSDVNFDYGRRDSCTSGFLTRMSGLDVNGMPEEHNTYVPHEDPNAANIVKANHNDASMEFLAYSSHPSPTSTISPEHISNPHSQNTPSSALPISRSSELAFALRSPDEQPKRADEQHEQTKFPVSPSEVNQPQHQYYGVPSVINHQSVPSASLEYVDSHHYTGPSHEPTYDASTCLNDGYSVDSHNSQFDYHVPIYNPYGGAVDPSIVPPVENGVQHAETFVTYA